jgi:N-methylhydantoinase B
MHPPYGLYGGKSGAPSNNELIEQGSSEQLPTKFVRQIKKGQSICHTTAGSGGYGNPLERDPSLVLSDVINDKVTKEAAKQMYGVCLNGPPWSVDEAATDILRGAHEKESN